MTLLLAFLAAFPQDPPPRENRATTIHGLVMPIPATWTRKEEQGVVFLTPPQIQSALPYLLLVFPPNKLQGGHWESHKVMVKALVQQAQWKGDPYLAHKVDGPGLFIKTDATGKTAAGEFRSFTLFTAVHDGVMEAVLGVNQLDRNVVDPVLETTTFKDPPKTDPRPKIVEAYRYMDQKMYINLSGGAQIPGNLQYERLCLLSNGVADFSTYYFEGYAASPIPLKVDPLMMSGDYGSWKAVGDKIHILRMAGAAPEVYERDGTGLKGGGKRWEPMKRVDGMKLSGRWEVPSDWIEFTPEGRFKVAGLLKTVATGDVVKARPLGEGAGTYEIRDWTIFFKFDDGTAWSTDFSIQGREEKPDASLLFRTRAYPKSK